MSDIIKDFNMIDFLGMLFPGALVILFFGVEINLWGKIETLWGAVPEIGPKVVAVIAGGYFTGMLLHEIGDILEWLVWGRAILNPRCSAAVFTGLVCGEFASNLPDRSGPSKIATYIKAIIGTFLSGALLYGAISYSGIDRMLWTFIVSTAWTKPLYTILSSLSNCLHCPIKTIAIICGAILLVSSQEIAMRCLYRWSSRTVSPGKEANEACAVEGSESRPKKKCISEKYITFRKRLWKLRLNDAYIMNTPAMKVIGCDSADTPKDSKNTAKVGNDSLRKRTLFDGFRTMARNAFIAVLLLCAYAAHSGGKLNKVYLNLIASNWNKILLFGFLLVLIIRYWHYSYLKYKYCYEDYLNSLP